MEKREKVVTLRVTEAELKLLGKAAEYNSTALATWIRQTIIAKARETNITQGPGGAKQAGRPAKYKLIGYPPPTDRLETNMEYHNRMTRGVRKVLVGSAEDVEIPDTWNRPTVEQVEADAELREKWKDWIK